MHSQNKDMYFVLQDSGPVVQLVRIHACHAWGREFESRPDRQQMKRLSYQGSLFLFKY